MAAMLYRVHFTADPNEPIPPVDTLPAIEADDPLTAADLFVAQGVAPSAKWARVVLSVHANGKPHNVLRVPIGDAAKALDDDLTPSWQTANLTEN
jgi:hypothetical protein